MSQREKLLRRVALKCADFARQLSYHLALADYQGTFTRNFWIYLCNNAIDLAVLDWFHLFGYHNDDLHWKQTVADVPAFGSQLFQLLQMTEDAWQAYRPSFPRFAITTGGRKNWKSIIIRSHDQTKNRCGLAYEASRDIKEEVF